MNHRTRDAAARAIALAAVMATLCAGAAEAQTREGAGQYRAAAGSPAAGPNALPSITIGYADLDTGSELGMRTLTNRIRSAVRRVCWQSDHDLELEEVYECRRLSMRDAWQQFERNQERFRSARDSTAAAIIIRS
ncbi:MAG: UrcA family protein [Caulobacter sp.]